MLAITADRLLLVACKGYGKKWWWWLSTENAFLLYWGPARVLTFSLACQINWKSWICMKILAVVKLCQASSEMRSRCWARLSPSSPPATFYHSLHPAGSGYPACFIWNRKRSANPPQYLLIRVTETSHRFSTKSLVSRCSSSLHALPDAWCFSLYLWNEAEVATFEGGCCRNGNNPWF